MTIGRVLFVLQNNFLLEFDSGNQAGFWSLWEEHIPEEIRHKDQTCRRLEFYIQIHFAVFPIRVGRALLVSVLSSLVGW